MNRSKENNPILKLTFEFAVQIVQYCEQLQNMKKYVIAQQLLKSGTSIGANIKEAQNVESKADFIHKLKIAFKEIEETEYWLEICETVDTYPNPNQLKEKLLEIRKIMAKIISTAKNKNQHSTSK